MCNMMIFCYFLQQNISITAIFHTLLNLLSLLCSVLDTTLIKIQQIDVKNKEQIYQREKGAL